MGGWTDQRERERERERERRCTKKIAETPESRSIARNMGGGSSSNPAPAAPHKKGKVAQQSAGVAPPPPKCQVEGCGMDLTGTKTYYCRHKVCSIHSKSPKVIVAGKEQRFCQQCSRFHQLNEFDQGKRSCRRRLAGHNERRRKPPPGLLSSHYGRLSSLREYGSGYQCFVMDFTSPNPPTNAKQTWPTIRVGGQVTCSQGQVPLSIPTASRVATQDVNTDSTYRQGSVGKVVFHDPCLDPNQSLVVADSSCALSLLSSQPLATLNSTSQFPVLPENSSQGAHTQISEPSMLSSLVDSCNAHAIPYDMGLGPPAETGYGQFSANFEPAPCVKSQYTDSGYERTYGSSSNLMHSGLYKPGCSFPLD